MAWYENARIFYDWIRYGEDLTSDYADWLVQKTLDVHANALTFCAVVGGYSLWESDVTPKYHHLGGLDLLDELARLCHENNLYFIPWWLATATGGTNRLIHEHPSWQQLGPPHGDEPGEKYNYVCYNSPYRELVYEEAREVLTNYEVDGIYFDQLPISCYCPWCQAKFERRYNQPMPVVTDEFLIYDDPAGLPPLLKEFRDDSIRSFCAGIRQIIDEIRPEACYAQNWVRNYQSHLAVGLADVILPEYYQEFDLVPLGLRHRLTKTYFDHGPVWGNVRHGVRHDARHHPVRSTKLLLADCVANQAVPVMLDLTAMDFDATGTEELAETFDHIRIMQEQIASAEPIHYAALLHSLPSHMQFGKRFEDAFEGLYRLLFEFHIPFEVVNEAGVQRGELEKFQVLILPDSAALADETVTAIQAAVDHGLGLVGTFMTGCFDDHRNKRNQPALANLFGYELQDIVAHNTPDGISTDPILNLDDVDGELFHYGSARTNHPWLQGLQVDGLFSFHGGFEICTLTEDVQIIADIHAVDQVRLNARPFNRRGHYPGPARWPLAFLREFDKSRFAYFAIQAEAENRRAHSPELDTLIVESILWVGGQPPLRTPDCPRTVEVNLFHDKEQKAYHLLLINQTTNPLVWIQKYSPSVVRFITPHKDLEFEIRLEGTVTETKSLMGTEVQSKQEGEILHVKLRHLDLYDSLVVEYT